MTNVPVVTRPTQAVPLTLSGLPGDKDEEPTPKDIPPSNSLETGYSIPSLNAKEFSLSQELSLSFISSFVIHYFPPFKTQVSSRRFSREGVIVRGPPSCPLFCPYSTSRIPTNRPVDPPHVPPPLQSP